LLNAPEAMLYINLSRAILAYVESKLKLLSNGKVGG